MLDVRSPEMLIPLLRSDRPKLIAFESRRGANTELYATRRIPPLSIFPLPTTPWKSMPPRPRPRHGLLIWRNRRRGAARLARGHGGNEGNGGNTERSAASGAAVSPPAPASFTLGSSSSHRRRRMSLQHRRSRKVRALHYTAARSLIPQSPSLTPTRRGSCPQQQCRRGGTR